MILNDFIRKKLLSEVKFNTSRSSGPGGQNVNKVNTKAELRFNIKESAFLAENQKALLLVRLKNKINSKGELVLSSEDERSQMKNKILVTDKFFHLIEVALTVQKHRKPTKPTRASLEKRLRSKKKHAEKKSQRGQIDLNNE
jgi:ribosome-associated protein